MVTLYPPCSLERFEDIVCVVFIEELPTYHNSAILQLHYL